MVIVMKMMMVHYCDGTSNGNSAENDYGALLRRYQ